MRVGDAGRNLAHRQCANQTLISIQTLHVRLPSDRRSAAI